jgi:hypothetical protein
MMLMHFNLIVALIAVFFNGIVLISSRNDQDVVQDLEWSHGSQKNCDGSNCLDIYVGVYNVVVTAGGTTSDTQWKDDNCTPDYCEDCEETMKGVIAFCVFALVLGLPSLFTNWKRAGDSGNTESNRTIGVITSLLAVIAAAIAIIWFDAGCQQSIYDDTHNSVNWEFGPSWVLMLIVLLLQFVNFIINLGVSTASGTFFGVATK